MSNFLAGKKFPLLLEKAKKGFHDLVIKCNFSEKAKLSPFLAFFCRKRRKSEFGDHENVLLVSLYLQLARGLG